MGCCLPEPSSQNMLSYSQDTKTEAKKKLPWKVLVAFGGVGLGPPVLNLTALSGRHRHPYKFPLVFSGVMNFESRLKRQVQTTYTWAITLLLSQLYLGKLYSGALQVGYSYRCGASFKCPEPPRCPILTVLSAPRSLQRAPH